MKQCILLTLFLLGISCNNDKTDCDGVVCTEEFRTIIVSIKDPMGNPVALDKFEVFDLDSGEDITREINANEFELMQQLGTYPIFGDEYSATYKNSSVIINFKGFVANEEIVNVNFKVGADCCHVYLIEGITEIQID